MKKDIHPEYREVLFHDTGVDKYFIIRSTLDTTQTKEWEDGKTYPYYAVDIYLLLHILFTLVNKKLLILVVEFKNLKRDLVKRNKLINLDQNSQNLFHLFQFLQNPLQH